MAVTQLSGVLLVNVGTPDSPAVRDVRRYLREFLSDPRVLDMPAFGRWLLLNLIILPLRPRHSARAYSSIWTPQGSPLMVHGQALAAALSETLDGRPVELAMRYGQPSLAAGFQRLLARGCNRVVVVPLYPQQAASTTGTAVEAVKRWAAGHPQAPELCFVDPFWDDAGFLDAWQAVTRPLLEQTAPDHVLFSFHGLPVSHVLRADPSGTRCLVADDCCEPLEDANRGCYRAQCLATARRLAVKLGLDEDGYTTSFQSRLGRAEWIDPHTERVLLQLPQDGVRRLLVVCPAFVADCLETLEEIGIRARESFREAGGEELILAPSLNAHPAWVAALARLVDAAGGPVTAGSGDT